MRTVERFFENTLPGQLIAMACAVGVPLMMVILL